MKRKHFILALVAMLWSFSFSAFAGDVIVVNNETELRAALAASGVQRTTGLRRAAAQQSTDAQSNDAQLITFGSDVTLTAPFETNVGGNYVLDLEGYALRGAAIDGTKHQYPFYNRATLIIKDSQGGGYIDCGVYNGYDTDGVTYSEARLEMVSGKIVCHDDEGAAIINYGTTIISGGSVEGSVNALKNVSGTMTVADGVSITGEVAGEVTLSNGVKYTVAKIGDNVYATFGEALAAANAMTGAVTMQIFGEVEFTDGMELNGSYTSINFVGKSAKAKMTVNQTAGGDYLTAHGKTVTFTDLTLAKANPAWQGNSGHMSQYFSIQGGTVTYTDCTFLNGACTSGGTATYIDCTFQNATEYGLWAYDDAVVTVNGGTIDSKKGIKVYSEDEASVTTTLTVQNATFTENVTAKPAVAIGYAESITLIGNTYNNAKGVLELDSGSDADCEGVTFVAQDENGNDISSTITATDRSNSDAACGVLVDGKIYTTVTEAAKEATETSTVTLLHSSDEVVEFPMGATIEMNGYTADNVTTAQPFADYVVLPISMTVNNYKAMFGDNTVTDGTNYYATLQAAVEAVAGKANTILYCKPGADVGSLQHAPVTSTLTVYGNDANVTGDTERDFDLGNTDPSGGKDITADMTLTVNHLNGCGAWGTKATEHTVNLVFENCANMGKVFINGTTGTLNITMTDCAFEGVIKEAVYSNADGAITLTNVAFANLNKAVNLNHKAAGTQTVTIDGCSFTNCGADVAADQIPVRVLSSVAGGKSVLAVNNTTFTGTPQGGADILLADGVGVTEATVTNTAANVKPGTAEMVAVTAQDSYEYNNIVAKIGDVEYASLQGAIDAVKNGDEIILVADCDEAIAFTQTKDVSFVLNGNDKTMTGSINITARAGKDAPSTLVIKNFNFETDEISHDFIKSVETNYYPNNITIQDCTFKGTSDINTEGYAVVAVRLKSANNITIKGCTGTGLHSFLQNTAGWNVTIDDVDITNSLSGFAMGTVQGTAIKNCDIEVQESGIRLDAQYNNNAVIADNKINAFIPVVVRKASVDGNITFSGANNFTATNNDGLWCAIGTSEYKENGVLPDAATGRVKVTLNDTGLNAEGIYGNFVPAAKIGEIEYATLADAIAAAKAGDVVKVFAGTYAVPTMKAGITIEGEVDSEGKSTVLLEGTLSGTLDNLTLKNLHIKGDNAQRWAYANGNLVFENVTFEATSVYAIHFDGIKEGATLLYKNCTIIGWAALGGSPESCKFEGCTIKDNGTYGVIRTYFDTEIKDCTFDVANAKTDDVYQDGIHVVGDAEATVDGCTNTNGEMKELVNISGKSVVVLDGVEIKNFAKIGDTHYQSFAEALNAVQAGETITLIRDVTVAEGESAEINGFNLTAEEGVKLINNGTVTVTGEAASLNIATFEGNPIELRNGKLVDSNIGANAKAETNTVNAFGTNNISGTTKIGGILSLGYLTNPTEQVVVNITGNFNGTNVLVRTNNGVDNLLNVGAADGERTTAHFGQLGAFADVNINNADVTYHYAFIRNDFNVTKSALAIADGGVNTYFSGNAKVVIDNSTWSLPGYANIGSYGGYNYGNADVTLKNGSSITATNLGVELEEGKEVKLTLEDTSSLTATKLSNQGSIVLASTEATITANSGVSNITTTVADYKLAYVDGAYKVVAKDYVAYIGEQGYESLAEALTAATDGETVSLSWAEGNPAIAMNGAVFGKNVTITGTANVDWSKGWLYVGRGGEGNATVTFDNANLTSASSNSNSGLGIHVSGREKDTDNKYDGTLVIKNSTIALDYLINRGAITVDGATLTVKNGFGIAGRPASETESGADATATITLENNAKLVVNNHQGMGLGQAAAQLEGYGVMNVNSGSTFETTQAFYVSAKGQMNVNGGTVKITGNLTNNGTVYVAGASTLDATVAGDGWFYMNGVTLNANTKLLGAKVAFINGENTVKGSTFKDGWFSVGIGQNAAAATAAAFAQANGITLGDVTVNVSDNATIYTSTDAAYSGWVGSAYSAEKDAHKYILNITNSLARFGYMHVSKDGELNATGHSDNKYEYAGNTVDFYAGTFINNGTVTLSGVDAWAMYSKISVDHADAVLNIVNGTKYMSNCTTGNVNANTFLYYKAGTVNVDETSSVNIEKATTLVDGAVLNIAGNVTAKGAITGNGAINFTNDAATLTTATTGLTIGYDLDADKKVVYAEGAYKVVDKLYVAQTDAAMYETLAAAVAAVEDGGTITMIANETFTENNRYDNGGWWDGLGYSGDKSFTIDLNNFTISQDGALNDYLMWFKNDGAKDNTITLKNGTLDAGTTAYCALATASSNAKKITVNLENISLINNNSNGSTVKVRGGAVLNVKAGTVITGKNSYLGIECVASTVNIYDGAEIYMNGTSSYNGCLVGACAAGTVNVYGGYGKGVKGGFIAMTSGGTINVAGGEWIANTDGTVGNNSNLYVLTAQSNKNESGFAGSSIINVTGGTFRGGMDAWVLNNVEGEKAELNISGGNFNANPTSYVAEDYIAVENNGVWNVVKAAVKVGETYYASLEAGLKALTDGATLTFFEDITVTEAWDCRYNGAKVTAANVTIDGNGKTLKIAGAVNDANWNTVFRFEGDNATVKNLTIDASEAADIQRGISSKLSLTVNNTTFIGNGTTAKRAIIFGEGAGASIGNVVATVTNSTFKNWSYGVSDNQNAQDAKNVTVTGNTFENAGVLVSASDQVVFSNNTLTDGGVNITSYTNVENVSVQAFNNTLDAEEINKITTNPARHMISGEGFSTPVAKMDGKYYVSIQDAVDSSTATGSEIILTVNRYLDMDEAVVIEGKVVTLNLNGKIVRATADAQMTGGIFRLLDGADLTITGEGEINYNGNANVYAAVGILGAANLTVENSKLVGYYYGITGNGLKDGSTITINGGEISSVEGTGSGIYHPQNGTLTVNGGTITGATGIYFKSGVLNITDGTINGTGAKVAYGHNGNGSDATGDALVIENVAAGNYEAVTSVAVTGGSFNSVNADPIASYAADGATALTQFVTGGTFNKTFSEECLPVGYQLKDYDSNGYYNVEFTNTRESMTFVDGEFTEYTIAKDMSIGTLTYKRANVPTTWAAFYFPFEVPVSQLAEQGFEVAYINGVRRNDTDFDGELDEFEMEVIYIHGGETCDGSGKTLKANYPYFIRAKEEAKDLEIVLEGATLYAAKNATYDCTTFTEKFEITGNTSRVTATDFGENRVNNYAVNKGSWYAFGETASLRPFRFYMTVSSRNGSEPVIMTSMSISVRGEEREDGTTFIYDVEMGGEQTADYIYDLQGRRVLAPQKGGLYIVNGKKVIF